MLVKAVLKGIPDELTVKESEELKEERLVFIVNEYNNLIADGVKLPSISDDTTFGEIKENLDNADSSKVIDMLSEYKSQYIKQDSLTILLKRVIGLGFVILIIFTFFLAFLSLTYAILKGTFDANHFLDATLNYLFDKLGVLADKPTPL